ncbi:MULTISPECIES: BACON domain-containing protein [Niastella]|uniref:BACON domain-containing protein n=1 Tax=Niastella soli TaxID=2821487 RepID=A0ABS3YSC6_9BACT|nr:BACON domain-containing protein [Niastella soli]MBO9200819.1 BACON domain-containing protein [Niastella soli]
MLTNPFPSFIICLLLILGYSCKKDAKGPDPILNISRTDIEVGNDVGYTDTVVIQSNIDWKVNVSDTWLSVDPLTNATGDTTILTIKIIAANITGAQTATVTITPVGWNGQNRQINITRKAYGLAWQKCYGGSEIEDIYSTTIFPNGQFVSTGYSNSTDGDASGNMGEMSGWTFRATSDGNLLWQRKINQIGVGYRSIAASPDGGAVGLGNLNAANQFLDLDVIKYDAAGNVMWNNKYGGESHDFARAIISTPDGGCLASGNTYSKTGDFISNRGGSDLLVVKFNANGGVVWTKTFGGAGDEYIATTAVSSDGGYVIVGYTSSNNSGDVGANHGDQDLLVLKIDANGNKVWSKTIGGSRLELSSSIIGDTDGGCIVMGQTNSVDGDVVGRSGSNNDMWVVKLTNDGQIGWQACLGGSKDDIGNSMVRLPNGNIAISSTSNSTDRGITGNHGSTDIWVVVLNNSGKTLWQKTFGSSAYDGNCGIAAWADGSMLVTNTANANDGDVSGNHGKSDTWIFKLQ